MTLSPGLCPWTPLGAEPPDPQYLLSSRAYHANKLCISCRLCTRHNNMYNDNMATGVLSFDGQAFNLVH